MIRAVPGKSAVLIPLATLWLLPQAASTPARQPQQRPTFRASTQLVEVDVNVTDPDGAFVPDLTLDDFQIFDEGRPRSIEIAYVVNAGRVTLAARGGNASGAVKTAPVATPPSGRRVIVFFFDTTHMKFGQLHRAGAAAEQFIAAEMNDGDVAGLVVGERMLNDRLTTDRAELLAGIRAASLAGESTSIASATGAGSGDAGAAPVTSDKSAMASAEINDALKQADQAVVSGATARTEVTTLEMLERLVDALSRVPGRKNVVFFSGGFSLFGVQPGANRNPDTLPLMRDIVDGAARSNVHIYSIDVTGLDKGVGSSGMLSAPESTSLAGMNARMRGPETTPEGVLTSLALDTGGLVFFNSNHYLEPLKRIDDDSSHYYVLAFRPDDKGRQKTGAYRALRVKIDRPHLTVRARKGYLVR